MSSLGSHLIRIPPSSGRRLAGVEGLRGIAAISILISHAWLYSDPTGTQLWEGSAGSIPFETLGLGVALFFALSGFLLYRPFVAAAFDPASRPSVSGYFRNRALRILPAYWVILLIVSLVLGAAWVRNGTGLTIGSLTDPGDLLSAALLLQDYRPSTVIIGIGPAWSLAVEVVFYLVLPMLGAIALALASRARSDRMILLASLTPAAILLLFGLSGKYAAGHLFADVGPASGYEETWQSVLVRSFWAQADLFSFGMAVAAIHVQVVRGSIRLPDRWRPAVLLAALPLGAVAAVRLAANNGGLNYPIENTLTAAVAAILLAVVVMPGPHGGSWRGVAALEAPSAVALGLISYSVFLWHEPLAHWLRLHGLTASGAGGLLVNIVVLLTITVALSIVTYRLVEVPALGLKARTRRSPDPPPTATDVPKPV